MKKQQEDTFQIQEGLDVTETPEIRETPASSPPSAPKEPPAAKDTPIPSPTERPSKGPVYDKYEHWDARFFETAGLYQLVPDENGRPRVRFTGPDGTSAEEASGPSAGRYMEETDEAFQNLRELWEERVGLEQLFPLDLLEKKIQDEEEEKPDE